MKKKIGASLFILTALFFCNGISLAVPAAPGFFETVQPDGTKIEIQMKGDEFYGWAEDREGYTVIQDATKEWRYAQEGADGALKPSLLQVGKGSAQTLGIPKRLRHRKYQEILMERRAQMQPQGEDNPILRRLRSSSASKSAAETLSKSSPEKAPAQGTVKNLVVLVAFSDKNFTLTNPQRQFDDLYNKIGYTGQGGKGSVKDFYLKTSYGNLAVDSIITDVITLDNTAAYYGGNDSSGNDLRPQQMVVDALKKLEASGFDFSQFEGTTIEGVTIIHAGRGEEAGGGADTIWSHKWNITRQKFGGKYVYVYNTAPELYNNSSITTIGVLCHEFGHVIGLPDLYDTTGNDSEGVGNFCLMGGGSWNYSGGNPGNSPSLFSVWCKKELGYVTIQNLPNNSVVNIGTASEDDSAFYKFSGSNFNAKEYFLIENRQGTSFDAGLPGPNRGILIWHIDETRTNNDNASRYMVDVEEADGSNDLALKNNRGKDSHYFRAGNKTEFTDSTNPNSKSYSGLSAGYPITNISASTSVMTFTVGTPPSLLTAQITSVLPSEITRAGSSSFTITGQNFAQGSLLKLIKDGTEINASSVSFVSASTITAVFPIPADASLGYWDLQISSEIYSNNPVIKSSAVRVKENMIISDVTPAFAFSGALQTFEITGTDYQDGALVTLRNENTVIEGIVLSLSQTLIRASFQMPENIAHGKQFDLTITNTNGDFITKTNSVTAYKTPFITQAYPLYAHPNEQTAITLTGENFTHLTKIILKKSDDIAMTITPQITSNASSSLTISFTPSHLHLGKWKIYCAAVEGATETEFSQTLEINVEGAIDSVLPTTTTRTTSSFSITGQNLLQDSSIKIIRNGVEINASSVSSISTTSITAEFPIFSSAPAGYWSLQISNEKYSNNPIIKSSAVFVKGDMSISDVTPAFAFSGALQTFEITGTDYQDGALVTLRNENTVIEGIVLSLSQTLIRASFQMPENIAHGKQFDLTITNTNGDFITKTNSVTAYRTPFITQAYPLYAHPNEQTAITLTGENFTHLTKIILKKSDDIAMTITPQITSNASSSLTISFTPSHLHLGKWKIYCAAVEGATETEFSQTLEIEYPEISPSTINLKAYHGGDIVFQVRSINGQLNDGYAAIPEMTFNKDADITVKQQTFPVLKTLNAASMTNSNIGVSVKAQNNMNANGIILKIPYTQDDIAGLDENKLVIAAYNEEKNIWVALKSFTDKDKKLVCAQIDRLGVFAIMGAGGSNALENVKYYPNPIRPSKGLSYARMNFANLPQDCKIIIYTQLGRVVQKLESDNSGMAVWDAKNNCGQYVSSGVYIAYIEDKNGNKKKIKIAVER